MRKIYITFGGSSYNEVIGQTVRDAPKLGADEVWVYDDLWLSKTEFRRHNTWLWDHHASRGVGWFAWKPYVMMDALSRVQDGDIILFTDGDTHPIADFSVLFEEVKKDGIMLFNAVGCWNNCWCKRDCFIVMGQDEPRYRDVQHAVARFFVFQKGRWKPQQFLMEWLTYCVNPSATTFDPSLILPEHPELHEHRCEQAILTNLAHRYGYRLYREACQYGRDQPQDQDLYPQLFEQIGTPGGVKDPTIGSAYRNVPDRDQEGL